jgi:hypothetical protein
VKKGGISIRWSLKKTTGFVGVLKWYRFTGMAHCG